MNQLKSFLLSLKCFAEALQLHMMKMMRAYSRSNEKNEDLLLKCALDHQANLKHWLKS